MSVGPILVGFFHFFAPRWVLDEFWGGFGGQDGTKSLQKSIFKSIKKLFTFQIALGIDFGRFWAPTWTPKRPRIPSWTHLEAILERKSKKIQPKWGPNSSLSTNMSPKTPKVAPGRPHVPHFHWFLIDFWWIFDTIFIDLCLIFYKSLMGFWYSLHWFLLDLS